MRVSFEKFLTLPSAYLTEDYDGDEDSEEERDDHGNISTQFKKCLH